MALRTCLVCFRALSLLLGLSLAFLLSHVSYHWVSCCARAAWCHTLIGHTQLAHANTCTVVYKKCHSLIIRTVNIYGSCYPDAQAIVFGKYLLITDLRFKKRGKCVKESAQFYHVKIPLPFFCLSKQSYQGCNCESYWCYEQLVSVSNAPPSPLSQLLKFPTIRLRLSALFFYNTSPRLGGGAGQKHSL